MSLTMDRVLVIKTGKENLRVHQEARANALSDAKQKMLAYAPLVAEAIASGKGSPTEKAPKITCIKDCTAEYEHAIKVVEHVSGSEIPGCDHVGLLLKDPALVSPPHEYTITFDVD